MPKIITDSSYKELEPVNDSVKNVDDIDELLDNLMIMNLIFKKN